MIPLRLRVISLAIMALATLTASPARAEVPRAGETTATLLPVPRSVRAGDGSLTLTRETSIQIAPACAEVGAHFAGRLRRGTGWSVPVTDPATITLAIVPGQADASPEAHTIRISASGIVIQSATPAGIARGTETLLQLMPPAVYGPNACDSIPLPHLTIEDAPAFPWRSVMLDVSRKFQQREDVIRLLDGMAACKLNIFHWHLTDDQGWRLPIEGYPKLTASGPAYTRDDIRAVVRHAAALGITVVPEVDMPGHSSASCRAYPEIATLNDKGQPTGTMNPAAVATDRFVDAVMKDVAAQFPDSPYVHIGADEVGTGGWNKDPQCQEMIQRKGLKGAHGLYLHFVNQLVAAARKYHKTAIAWDEAFDPANDPALVIMSWRGMAPGIRAAKAGRTVIMCPNPPLYVNHANSRSAKNPRAYSAHTAYLNDIYHVYPDLPAIPRENRKQVLGAGICLWGEVVTGPDYMFTHLYPRAFAMGENLWMPRTRLDWQWFVTRMEPQFRRFEAMRIPCFREPESLAATIDSWQPGDIAARKGVIELSLDGKLKHAGIQEFTVVQGPGEGRFRVDAVELIKDGTVVDQDRHAYESAVYNNVANLYLVSNPDTIGRYSLRIRVTQLEGDCAAIVQHIPALPADGYSKQCSPESGANRTKQLPPSQ